MSMTESERALITLQNAMDCATDDATREDLELAIQALEKVQQFEAIGTIERFRELTEKADPKKVVIRKIPKTEWTRAVKQYICPSCDAVISFGGKRYCSGCGQRLDWE